MYVIVCLSKCKRLIDRAYVLSLVTFLMYEWCPHYSSFGGCGSFACRFLVWLSWFVCLILWGIWEDFKNAISASIFLESIHLIIYGAFLGPLEWLTTASFGPYCTLNMFITEYQQHLMILGKSCSEDRACFLTVFGSLVPTVFPRK